MKNILKTFLAVVGLISIFSACKKIDPAAPLPHYSLGMPSVLSSSVATVAPALADTSRPVITFSWTNPKYAQDTSLYKYVIEIDSTGHNFANQQNAKTVTGALNVSLTGRDLNAVLLNLGFKLNVAQKIDVRVKSSYGNNNEGYMSNVLQITVTPFADPSNLSTANTSVTCSLANASLHSNTFYWTPSFIGYPGTVTYSLQYDSAGKNFVAPTTIAVGASLYSLSLLQSDMNTMAFNSGIPYGNTGKVEYRVQAVTAWGAVTYSNVVNVTIASYVPILRVYLPGGYQSSTGNGNDWDPGTAPELIRDLRSGLLNNMYYIYIYLPAGAQFKATVGRSWNVNYGGTGGVLSSGGANFSVATAGYYRISVNIGNLTYDISTGRMGFVGGAVGSGWNPPNVFPTYACGAAATNLFVGLTNFTSGGWKLIDNTSWNNGSGSVSETRSYGTANGSGSTLEVNGSNFNDFASAGRYRVIWDGRDVNNVKYWSSSGAQMRVVGDGINMAGVGVWDPGTSPQMTYIGNGIWTASITFYANKSFTLLAGNAWGAFQYNDNGSSSNATGVPRPIVFNGGGNFATVATAGTYTVTLNEYTQTVTIN